MHLYIRHQIKYMIIYYYMGKYVYVSLVESYIHVAMFPVSSTTSFLYMLDILFSNAHKS